MGIQDTQQTAHGSHSSLSAQRKLQRFFQRLGGELLESKADLFAVERVADELQCRIERDSCLVKQFALKSSWLPLISAWLSDRLLAESREEGALCGFAAEATVFRARLLRTPERIALSSIVPMSSSLLLDELEIDAHTRELLPRLTAENSGLIAIGRPDTAAGASGVAILRTLSELMIVGPEALQGPQSLISESREAPIAVLISSSDAFEAFYTLYSSLGPEGGGAVRGALALAVADQLCPNCSRDVRADRRLVAAIPCCGAALSRSVVRDSAGCARCPRPPHPCLLTSALVATPQLLSTMCVKDGIELAADLVYAEGVSTLLADGVRRVNRGAIALEPLLRAVPQVSQQYQGYSVRRGETLIYDSLSEIEGDFFLASGAEAQPLAAVDAFSMAVPESAAVEDQPLFTKQSLGTASRAPLVLVVEDDNDQRSIIEMVLGEQGYRVLAACNGAEALALAAKHSPDLIVTDLMMPVLDGSELIRKVRADPAGKRIPILVLTVLSDSDKECALLDLGADDYCEKTVPRKLLLKRVEKLLARSAELAKA